MLYFVRQGVQQCFHRKVPFSHWESEVGPNYIEMAQDFMYTLLMAVLKDHEVFRWFWKDLMLEVASPILSQEESSPMK